LNHSATIGSPWWSSHDANTFVRTNHVGSPCEGRSDVSGSASAISRTRSMGFFFGIV
jgi:hypothetical protein